MIGQNHIQRYPSGKCLDKALYTTTHHHKHTNHHKKKQTILHSSLSLSHSHTHTHSCHIPQNQAQAKERTWLAKDQGNTMAQAMASMAGSLQVSGSTRLHGNRVASVTRAGFTVRAQQQQQQQVSGEAQSSRRAVLSLVAAGLATGSFVQAVLADAKSIKVGPPPPPSGGLRKSIFLSSPYINQFILKKLSFITSFQRVYNGCFASNYINN